MHASTVHVCPQLTLTNTGDFLSALRVIVQTLHLRVIEQMGDSASLYGSSIASHHICILVKAVVSAWNVCISVEGLEVGTYWFLGESV